MKEKAVLQVVPAGGSVRIVCCESISGCVNPLAVCSSAVILATLVILGKPRRCALVPVTLSQQVPEPCSQPFLAPGKWLGHVPRRCVAETHTPHVCCGWKLHPVFSLRASVVPLCCAFEGLCPSCSDVAGSNLTHSIQDLLCCFLRGKEKYKGASKQSS